MIASQIAGWILFAIGVGMYLLILVRKAQSMLGGDRRESLGEIKDTLEALTKLLEAFAKFSEDIQFLLLGSGCLAAGIYLLANEPF